MALSPQSLPLEASPLRETRTRATVLETCASCCPLLPAAGAAWLGYSALVVLLSSPAIRAFDAGSLAYCAALRWFAHLLAPDALLSGDPDSAATIAAIMLYLAIAAVTFGSWRWALRTAQSLNERSPLPMIGLTAIIASPLLVVPGLFSDDVYLYNLYGRAISVYGANPVLSPPSAFASDPHLPWVHWTELPSAYGPIWLMLSALLSALAGDSIDAVVLLYRVAGLVLHLVAVGVLWRLLRDQRHSTALRGTLFYAWNPLVLLEVVANAHNDVLVALFGLLLIGAATQRRWSRAAVYAACVVMVKPFAVILVPAAARQLWRHPAPGVRYRQIAVAIAVGTAVVLALNLPLWSGDALLRNALHNPAARMYTNTLWELAWPTPPEWFAADTDEAQHPNVDVLRSVAFLCGVAWVLARRASSRDIPQVGVRLWLVFCVTAGWIWPWYFVPVLALAPLAGATALPTATALTVGGLLFWAAWPERNVAPLQALYEWRALLLFGPLMLMWISAHASSVVRLVMGAYRHRAREGPSADLCHCVACDVRRHHRAGAEALPASSRAAQPTRAYNRGN